MQFKDYYETLGVEPSAGEAEIKTAYRRLARKYHPDVSKEAGAEEKFKAVNEAYEALRDPQKRAAYDQLRARGYRPGDEVQPPPGGFGGGGYGGGVDFEEIFAGGGAGGGFSDFFESLFGRGARRLRRSAAPQPRGDTRAKLAVSLETVYDGGSVRICGQRQHARRARAQGHPAGPGDPPGRAGRRRATCCWKSSTPRIRSSKSTAATSSTCCRSRRGKPRWVRRSACRRWAARWS